MIEKIRENIYKIEVNLPKNPLKVLNTYVIKGEERSLLIDTGFNRPECKEELFKGLEELNIALEDLDVLLTHHHSDHSGQVHRFKGTSQNIYASDIDGRITNEMANVGHWEEINKKISLFDLDKYQIEYNDHPGFKFALSEEVDFKYLKEGDRLNYGGYEIEIVHTPGHTPGLIGLYIRSEGIYIGGDHILDIITPNISFYSFESRDLETYLKSLDKVKEMDIKLILPSHRNLMEDHPRRVIEIKDHHLERLEEVFQIITEEKQTVSTIASKMDWRIRAKSWEDFPKAQKWFASSEAVSHLEYLYNDGRISRIIEDGLLYYYLD